MSLTSDAVFDEAMRLPENEQRALMSRLLETIPVDDSAISVDDEAFFEELDRRSADREGCVDWADLRAER
jgi:hypothetical protein